MKREYFVSVLPVPINFPGYLVKTEEESIFSNTYKGAQCNIHRKFSLEWNPGSNKIILCLHVIYENNFFFREEYQEYKFHTFGILMLESLVRNFTINKLEIEKKYLLGKLPVLSSVG